MSLPEPIRAYIAPVPDLSNFVLLPWIGFVFAGAVVGLVLDGARQPIANAAPTSPSSPAASRWRLPPIARRTRRRSFRTPITGRRRPSFFLLRLGILVAAVGGAWLWEQRRGGIEKRSPLRQLGRTSLFIYWIHVEMVYGLISLPLHRSLSWMQSWLAFVLFSFFMLLCSIAKDRLVTRWKDRRQGARIDSDAAASA